jgi:peptide deformylase
MGETTEEREERKLDPEREARRRVALAQVRQYPDPVLRMRARDVESFDPALAELAARMAALMHEARGIGLAAPQIGILQRVLVYQAGEDEPVVTLVNPQIVASSEEVGTDEEGCLSLAGASVVVDVERPVTVTVEATSPDGNAVRIEAEGLEARVVQHEIDHLDGVLILDRTAPDQRKGALAKLRPQPVLGPLV